MGYETSKFGKADGSNVLSTVSTHFGQRDTGGSEGPVRTAGAQNEYTINLDGDGRLDFPFPVGVKVTGVVDEFATGTLTALTIGGVSVTGATEEAPVDIPSGNTGAVVVTGLTAGTVIIKYMKVV